MKLKMNYNSFIKLKDFFKIVDITAEVKDYITKNDTLEGNLEIHGKYQKRDGITEEYFLENVPFSIVFKNNDYDINDIVCTDIDYVAIDGRGVDVTFDILVDYYEYEEIPVKLDTPIEQFEESKRLSVEVSEEWTGTQNKQVVDDSNPTLEEKINTVSDNDMEDESSEAIRVEPIDLETETISETEIEAINNQEENIDSNDIEKIKKEETDRIDSLLKSTLNFKDDNLPTEEIVIRGIPEEKSKIKVCYYQNDQDLEKVCEKNNISLDKVFKANRNRNIEKYHRVIINESPK